MRQLYKKNRNFKKEEHLCACGWLWLVVVVSGFMYCCFKTRFVKKMYQYVGERLFCDFSK